MADVVIVSLRRMDTSQPWGFRMKGGADQGIPLHAEHVAPNSRAAKAGLAPGDMILAICGTPATQMTHGQVKQEILRAGNDLDLQVQKVNLQGRAAPAPAAVQQQSRQEEPRVQIIEEPTCKLGGPMYKPISQKTNQILQQEFAAADSGKSGQARPASIFNRKKDDRSGYLKAQGSTIQKAYGEG